MAKTSYNSLYKQQNSKLIRATFKKAIINSINVSSNTANISIVGNSSTVIKNVPLASHILISNLVVGDKCRVDLFDETNPTDMVIAYIYGRSMPYQKTVQFNSGFNIGVGVGTNKIAHGLGIVPDVSWVIGKTTQINNSYNVPFPTSVDATYIYFVSDPTFTGAISWGAIKF